MVRRQPRKRHSAAESGEEESRPFSKVDAASLMDIMYWEASGMRPDTRAGQARARDREHCRAVPQDKAR